MSPEIAAQLRKAGAWGASVATIQQAAVMMQAGEPRLLPANEIGGAKAGERLGRLLAAYPATELFAFADAVFCANDLLATGAVIEARHREISVPARLAILGFGDNDTAGQITPALTTITMDAFALGRQAGRMIQARLAGASTAEAIETMQLDLLIRCST